MEKMQMLMYNGRHRTTVSEGVGGVMWSKESLCYVSTITSGSTELS